MLIEMLKVILLGIVGRNHGMASNQFYRTYDSCG